MIKNASIRVAVKIKPTPQQSCIAKSIVSAEGQFEVQIKLPGDQDIQRIQVDLVHDANVSKDCVFDSCKINQLIGKFIQGYNVTILTYGQTGAGKTYALEGEKTPQTSQGIIPKSIKNIFQNKTSLSTLIKCSYIQLYNEKISDMLSTEPKSLEKGLKIRWEAERQFVIEDLLQKVCDSGQQMQKQWIGGAKNRVISSNKIHDYSSRSHSVFIITMEDEDQQANYRTRQIMFVDLAGSQRIFSPIGRLSKESIQINKSLFFLRKVISTLQEINSTKKQAYVPYRDAKLTSILKKAFGGNCLTLLIACIDGHVDHAEESLATLQYAVSASKIKNQVNINIDLKAREILELRLQNQKLKKQLELASNQISLFKSIEKEQQNKRKSNSQYANRIVECIGTVRELLKSNKELREQLDQQKCQKNQFKMQLEQTEKKFKLYRREQKLQPVSQIIDNRLKLKQKQFRIYPQNVKSTKNSASLDLFPSPPKKQPRQSSVIRRRKFLLHQQSPRQARKRNDAL